MTRDLELLDLRKRVGDLAYGNAELRRTVEEYRHICGLFARGRTDEANARWAALRGPDVKGDM